MRLSKFMNESDNMVDKFLYSEDLEVVKKALESGANINVLRNGFTPLAAAIMFEDIEMANFFLDKGSDVNIESPTISKMGWNNLFEILHQKIIKYKGDNEQKADEFRKLMARIEKLTKKKMNESKEDIDAIKKRAVNKFLFSQNTKEIQMALENGADINDKGMEEDFFGSTALFEAVYKGNINLIRFLLSKGADPHIKNEARNMSPLEWINGEINFWSKMGEEKVIQRFKYREIKNILEGKR